jgi:hypothetical protein
MSATPTHEEIAAEAYALYLAHGLQDGRDQEDWFEAERSLIERRAPRAADAPVAADTIPARLAAGSGVPR